MTLTEWYERYGNLASPALHAALRAMLNEMREAMVGQVDDALFRLYGGVGDDVCVTHPQTEKVLCAGASLWQQ